MGSIKTSEDISSELEAANRLADLDDPVQRKRLERELLRKLDLRMSFLVILMILNIIDRNNVPAARLRGLEEELGLNSTQYSTIISIYFIGYILMQVPSNMLMNYLGKPSAYLPCCSIAWGLVTVLTGITANFTGVLLCQFFLGAIEAAFLPGALFLMSRWYKRDELGIRSAILFCGSFVSSAFGSLMASGILDSMGGRLGQSAWRWLFFIEGAITIAVSLLGFLVLPDFPSTPSRWLTPTLQALAEKRVHEEAGSSPSGVPAKAVGYREGFVLACTDWKIWWIAGIMFTGQLSYSFVIFFPTLTKTLGYDTTLTLLLCAPPWVMATIYAFAVTRHSDVVRERCWHSVAPMATTVTGFIIAMSTMNIPARYISLFLMAVAPVSGMCIMAWAITSIQPSNKRAVGIALINGVSQLALVAGPYAWNESWGPSYIRSFGICLASGCASVAMAVVLRQYFVNLNEKAHATELERGQVVPGFRYML